MLSKAQEKVIRSLSTKKGRQQHGLCLVEGWKLIRSAGDAVEFTFTPSDSLKFEQLVTTKTPQKIAGVAIVPEFHITDIAAKKTVVILDGVQDPGNIGAVLRLCQGFNASLILVECADITNPKVVRSSAGALFHVPWIRMSRDQATKVVKASKRPVYRLENTEQAQHLHKIQNKESVALIVGSEGNGIIINVKLPSIKIRHRSDLESLNVANALAIALHARYQT